MSDIGRPPISQPSVAASRMRIAASRSGRRSTARPQTALSTFGVEDQNIVCAVSESRGISPTVGLAFINLDTGEAILCQINDNQTFARTIHKMLVFSPTTVLMVSTAAEPKSKLFSIIEDCIEDIGAQMILLDRLYWTEGTGMEYIEQLAFADDINAIKSAIDGNYYAICCFAAALKYIELGLLQMFPPQSLRVRYEPCEDTMIMDLSTICSLELVQNLHHNKSIDSLFGLLNETYTPMGARLLKNSILQPLTDAEMLRMRYDALEEISSKEELFFAIRQALRPIQDVDRMLAQLIIVPVQPSLKIVEQAVNNVLLLKTFTGHISPLFEALGGNLQSSILLKIRAICAPQNFTNVRLIIDDMLNEDTAFAQRPLDLRNQRTYAVRSGRNGLLDVARQMYKEAMTDALEYAERLSEACGMSLETKFEYGRQFYFRIPVAEYNDRDCPAVFINVLKKKHKIECQTLDLLKMNQKIIDAHTEVLMLSDSSIKDLISRVRAHLPAMFKISEAIGMLDMLSSFAQCVTIRDYVRPHLGETLALKGARHPILEKIRNKYIPNDVYATQQTRFQIITGCNMSGKSTYIRSVALTVVVAQIGCFVPAQVAHIAIRKQLFARVAMDDSIEANLSTFSMEMRESALVLRNVDRDSLAIIDELGRGTSTRDGLAIAIAISEALIESRSLIFFATHFRDLAHILAERSGVVNMHLQVDMSTENRIEMSYRLAEGASQDEHYGLRIARIMPLPRDIHEHAERVTRALDQQAAKRKDHSLAIVQARRKKLVLNLKEHLTQARNGSMSDPALKQWLIALQKEFIQRMLALDQEKNELERDHASVAEMVDSARSSGERSNHSTYGTS